MSSPFFRFWVALLLLTCQPALAEKALVFSTAANAPFHKQDGTGFIDLVLHEVAREALVAEEVADMVLALMLTAWTGPRICQVAGELAEESYGLPGLYHKVTAEHRKRWLGVWPLGRLRARSC